MSAPWLTMTCQRTRTVPPSILWEREVPPPPPCERVERQQERRTLKSVSVAHILLPRAKCEQGIARNSDKHARTATPPSDRLERNRSQECCQPKDIKQRVGEVEGSYELAVNPLIRVILLLSIRVASERRLYARPCIRTAYSPASHLSCCCFD